MKLDKLPWMPGKKLITVVIKPDRRKLLQKIVFPFLEENSKINDDKYKDTGLDIANLNPISLASMIDANNVLLPNEKRMLLGFDSIDNNENISE